jgi:hypothetical protein
LAVPPTVLTLGGPDRAACFDHHEQHARVFALSCCLSVLYEHVAGEADEMVGMIGDIGHDGSGFSQAV